MVLNSILCSQEAEKVLMFITVRERGYAYEIAKFYKTNLRGIQKQLQRLEYDGVLSSKKVGRTRVFTFDPRYLFLEEVKQLLNKALEYYPPQLREDLIYRRERPRRTGKPL